MIFEPLRLVDWNLGRVDNGGLLTLLFVLLNLGDVVSWFHTELNVLF